MDIKKFIRKIVLVVILAGIILGVAFVVVNWQSLFTKKTVKVDTNEISIKDTSLKIVDWLNKSRTIEKIYPFGCVCVGEECKYCKMSGPSQREQPFIIWGRYKYYKAFNNADDLAKINEELTTISKLEMQFEDWNCRILLNIYQDSKIPNDTKQRVAEVCANDGRPSVDFRFITDLSQSAVDHNNISINAQKIIANQPVEVDNILYNKVVLKLDFEKFTFHSSENIAKILILGKDKNKIEPKINFQYALLGYSLLNAESLSIYNNSILGVASLDMYRYYEEQVYLDLANYLYQQNQKLVAKDIYKDVAYQTLFLEELAKETGSKKYTDEAKTKIQMLLKGLFNTTAGAIVTNQSISAKNNGFILGIINNQ